jgi:hypothetical protein
MYEQYFLDKIWKAIHTQNVKIRAGIARSSSIAYTFCVDVTQCVLRLPTANPDKNLAPAGFFVFIPQQTKRDL